LTDFGLSAGILAAGPVEPSYSSQPARVRAGPHCSAPGVRLAARPDRGIPANSAKSRSTTRYIASGGYTVVGLSQIRLFEPHVEL
jgi:hypothetical protein